MKLIPVTDRSPEVLQKIVKEHFSDDAEETLRLLEKIQEPYFITEGGEITGYLNLKQYQKTIYIPIYLKCLPDESEIRGLAMEIQAELRTLDHKYFCDCFEEIAAGDAELAYEVYSGRRYRS